jgi:hypothetical protein
VTGEGSTTGAAGLLLEHAVRPLTNIKAIAAQTDKYGLRVINCSDMNSPQPHRSQRTGLRYLANTCNHACSDKRKITALLPGGCEQPPENSDFYANFIRRRNPDTDLPA